MDQVLHTLGQYAHDLATARRVIGELNKRINELEAELAAKGEEDDAG